MRGVRRRARGRARTRRTPAACNIEGAFAGGALGEDYRSRAGLPVVNVAGCAPHPGWILETIAALRMGDFGQEDLDAFGRPKFYAKTLAHHGCERNEYYEFKASAEKLSDIGCLMEHLGCKATQAVGDCNQRGWNGSGSCTHGGYPCIACTSPGFEKTHNFLETAKVGGIPVNLPLDMPKAWFVALAALSKSATPVRLSRSAHADRILPRSRARKGAAFLSRVVVGPFNRVEGDLEVALDIREGRIESARVTTTLYRGFEQILVGRAPLDALVIAPRICGICSLSQSVAASAALRTLAGATIADNGVLATNIAHAAENIADHLTHFYVFFMPDFARQEYADRPWFAQALRRFKATSGEAARLALPARRRLMEAMGLLAGKWPHSLAFQPGGVTRAVDMGERVRLFALIGEFQTFLESTLFGVPLDEMLAIETLAELQAYAHGPGAAGDFAAFLRIADDLDLGALGRGPGDYISFGAYHAQGGALFAAGARLDGAVEAIAEEAIGEHVDHAWFSPSAMHPFAAETSPDAVKDGAYSWAKAPRYRGRPMEVGAIARQALAGHPLIADLMAVDGGSSVRGRVIARVLEIALLTHAIAGWTRNLRLKEAFCNPFVSPERGRGAGLVEAARGALGHWLVAGDHKIERYQIISPTTWNFSPRDREGKPGPLESALAGVDVGVRGAKAAAIQHVVRSFDPCMVCTAH